MGLGAIKLEDMEEYIRVVMACWPARRWRSRSRASAQQDPLPQSRAGLINTRDPMRLHISAFGPRARALTAKLGAGWMNFVGDVPAACGDGRRCSEGWRKAGRDATATCTAVAFALGCVLARRRAGRQRARHGAGRTAGGGAAASRGGRGAVRAAEHVTGAAIGRATRVDGYVALARTLRAEGRAASWRTIAAT